jgi:predicted DNA-binding transcriptional regulator AlpA
MNKVLPIAAISTPPVSDSMLIDARRLAELLDVSKATFDRMKAAGKLPRHIELSRGCHRWRLSEVRDWIDAGCPPIKEWEARRRVEKGGPR